MFTLWREGGNLSYLSCHHLKREAHIKSLTCLILNLSVVRTVIWHVSRKYLKTRYCGYRGLMLIEYKEKVLHWFVFLLMAGKVAFFVCAWAICETPKSNQLWVIPLKDITKEDFFPGVRWPQPKCWRYPARNYNWISSVGECKRTQ